MPELRPYTVNILLLVIFLGATSVFVFGFFPVSHSSTQRACLEQLPKSIGDISLNQSLYRSHYNKSILMVIDALRTDFVERKQFMTYIHKLLNTSDACQLNIHVQAPTVTLPRIKSLTTGTVPNFIDIVLNFGSAAISTDSIIHQLREAGRKIVFLGDDTWVKLFPDTFTRQFENKDSLFVNDFDEGDKNISSRLNAELKHADWELLIMHFLGLDHIGHVEGPFSGRIPGKLREMDYIAQRVHLELLEWKRRINLPTLLLVTGDHGMRDTGGHGGNSPSEVHVPLIVAGAGCASSNHIYEQIDIAPTLSILLGLPIPDSSIGSLIPELLSVLSEDEQLFALYYNGKRLIENIGRQIGDTEAIHDKEYFIQFQEATQLYEDRLRNVASESRHHPESQVKFKRMQLLFVSSAREIGQQLSTKFVNYDYMLLAVGLVYATMTLILIVLQMLYIDQRRTYQVKFRARSLITAFLVAMFVTHLLCQCHNMDNTFAVCQANILVSCVSVVFAVLVAYFLTQILRNTMSIEKKTKSLVRPPSVVSFVLLATAFHAISLASSSFVEEEHQIWYYFGKTLLLVLAAVDWWTRRTAKIQLSVPEMGVDLSTRNLDASALLIERWIYRYGEAATWICVLLAHVFLPHLNRTGDKWLSIPDIGDWLVQESNIKWNSLFVGVAFLILLYQCTRYAGVLTNVLILTASVLIYYYHAQQGAILFPGIKASSAMPSVTVFWLNILEISCINYVPVIYKIVYGNVTGPDVKSCLGANVVLVCIVGAILHKPHNIVLTGLLLMTIERVNTSCDRCFTNYGLRYRLFLKTAAHVWLAQMFFFYQGNSNSLASIDLNAGYVGFKSFHFALVAFFLTLNTYHSFFVSFAALLYNAFEPAHDRQLISNTFNQISLSISGLVALPVTVYLHVTVAFRSHLFVWTVFSPKLIYEFFHLVLVTVTLMTVFLVNRFT